jgi:predicted TPR repeat methyltransferase
MPESRSDKHRKSHVDDEFARALSLHRAGKLAEAELLYRQILAKHPQHAEALHLLGLIACQAGQLQPAADLIARALSLMPDNAEFLLNLGEVQRRLGHLPAAIDSFHRAINVTPQNPYAHYNLALALTAAGNSAGAIAAYRQALANQPSFPEALNNLGLLLHQSGAFPAAVDCFQRAVALRPHYPEAHNNLGLSHWEQRQPDEALVAFSRAIELKPDFAFAHSNAAIALRRLDRRSEALEAFRRAAKFRPQSAEIQRDMAMALVDLGRFDEAVAACRRALELAPQSPGMHHALGVALTGSNAHDAHTAEAIAAYDQALRLKPEAAEWQFERASLAGLPLSTAPDAYIQSLFDEYALRFEHHLVDELQYRVPQDLLDAVLRLRKPPQNGWDILDLGCGTGLCGELFGPHARQIIGVDLSANMIDLARKRGHGRIYNQLHHCHILEALQKYEHAFDLILSGDVFIYVGALEAIFSAAARALRPSGILAFSLEHHDGDGFILHRQRRFAHSLSYIRSLAEKSGFIELRTQPCALRSDVPPGWIVILQKPA